MPLIKICNDCESEWDKNRKSDDDCTWYVNITVSACYVILNSLVADLNEILEQKFNNITLPWSKCWWPCYCIHWKNYLFSIKKIKNFLDQDSLVCWKIESEVSLCLKQGQNLPVRSEKSTCFLFQLSLFFWSHRPIFVQVLSTNSLNFIYLFFFRKHLFAAQKNASLFKKF